ncbi:MAG: type II toxin-antitoxin system CcdA family antitoxin [Paracoccaceae bacterium]
MPATRRATSLTLDAAILAEAKALGVNVSRAAEAGVLAELKKARAEAWKRENAEAIAATNRYIEEHGLPLEEYRMF